MHTHSFMQSPLPHFHLVPVSSWPSQSSQRLLGVNPVCGFTPRYKTLRTTEVRDSEAALSVEQQRREPEALSFPEPSCNLLSVLNKFPSKYLSSRSLNWWKLLLSLMFFCKKFHRSVALLLCLHGVLCSNPKAMLPNKKRSAQGPKSDVWN